MTNRYSLKNRTYCDCLMEMREFLNTFQDGKLTEIRSSHLFSLIEELQTYGNRMEAAIYDYKEVLAEFETLANLKREIRKKTAELGRLNKKG